MIPETAPPFPANHHRRTGVGANQQHQVDGCHDEMNFIVSYKHTRAWDIADNHPELRRVIS
ncbi:hypothetical protein CFAEC_06785 [Corynebacterium faecale]|nr:hypothetical protein CFAEC_06785 [Corynebacterium faecale]